MALKTSNLYAERVFAEHPLALWAFDEENSYLSLITSAQRDIKDNRYWSITDATIEEILNPIDNNPFPDSPQIRLQGGEESLSIETTDQLVINFPNDVDPQKNSICLSFYSYQFFSASVESYVIDMFYMDGATEVSLGTQSFAAPQLTGWGKVITTFSLDSDILESFDENFTAGDLRFRITVLFTDSFVLTHLIQISGLSIGQWSESFNSNSLGVEKLPLPSSISHLINQVSTKNNLISDNDSSFETDLGNWIEVDSIVTRTDEDSRDRDYSAKIQYLDSSSTPGIIYGETGTMIEVNPNQVYTISAWVKSGESETHNIRIRALEFTDEQDTVPVSETTSTASSVDDEWEQIFYTFTTNAATNFLLFKIEKTAAFTSGQSFLLDEVLITNSSFVRDYYKYSYTPLDSYGLDDSDNGYYLIEDNRLLSRTSGPPMVFGSNHTTKIFAPLFENNPAVLIPGKGFLNQAGQYNVLTLEAWLRLENVSPDPVKIIGPPKTVVGNSIVDNLDGLYLEEGFITMRVGDYSKSYFVGRWLRPMLLHIVYKPESITVLINGSTVIDMPIDLENTNLAPQEALIDGEFKNFDYIGIYGNQFVTPFEMDIVSIYPYEINSDYAKRRFIWGQGVAEQSSANEKYASYITAIDFANSEFTSNMIYPDINGWANGFSQNLNASGTMLKVPDLPLPTIEFATNNESEADWLFSNYLIQEEDETFTRPTSFFKMRPNPDYDSKFLNIYFNNLSEITTTLRSIVATFKSPESSVANQTLFRIENRSSRASLTAFLDENELKYIFSKPGESDQQVGASTTINNNTVFVAGIDIQYLSTNYYSIFSNFFASPDLLSLNFGGYQDSIFDGRIYTLSIDNPFSFSRGLETFFDEGLISQVYDLEFSVAILLTSWSGNYTLIPLELNSTMALDIAISGYWEDSQPLSYFGKFIKTRDGRNKYDLDMIQFNIDLPKPSIRKVTLFGQYNYGRLKEDWAFPIQRSYADLSDVLQGGYLTYADLAAAQAEYEFEGLGVAVNTFLTLQTYSSVGKKPYTDFDNTLVPQFNNVVDLDTTTLDFETTKFQLVDGSIIIPPKVSNFEDYYITLHIDVNVRGIKSKPFGLKRMELASFTYNETAPQAVGTRFGNKIYPFTRFGQAYAYKEKNPFRINKESSPYLYLTETSGIQPVSIPSLFDRGVAVPINENILSDYSLGAAQIWTRYSLNVFSNVPTKMFRIQGKEDTIDFYVYADGNQTRGIIKPINAVTGKEYEKEIFFYQDGKFTTSPVIYPREWTAINATFGNGLSMESFVGSIELYEGFTYDNIIAYKNSDAIERQSNVYQLWGEFAGGTWQDIYGSPPDYNQWNISSIRSIPITFVIDSVATYNSQIGLSIAVIEDESSLQVNSAGVDLFMENQWDEFFIRPI